MTDQRHEQNSTPPAGMPATVREKPSPDESEDVRDMIRHLGAGISRIHEAMLGVHVRLDHQDTRLDSLEDRAINLERAHNIRPEPKVPSAPRVPTIDSPAPESPVTTTERVAKLALEREKVELAERRASIQESSTRLEHERDLALLRVEREKLEVERIRHENALRQQAERAGVKWVLAIGGLLVAILIAYLGGRFGG